MRRRHPLAAVVTSGLLVVAAVLFVPLTGATASAANPHGALITVGPPNGVDDTASLQAALDSCVAGGPNCVVQLSAGTYLAQQLVAYNFQGTFRGAGMDATTIEALPELSVVQNPMDCLPNTSDCRWPTLIMFVDGHIHVSDLGIRITAEDGTATTGWNIWGGRTTSLIDALRFMGQNPTDATVDRVSIQGKTDDSANSFGVLFGFPASFNVVNGIIYTGELPDSSSASGMDFLSGALTVRDSSFSTMMTGISQDGFLTSSHITIGGAPSAGNQFDNLFVGIDLESSQNSTFDISHNDVSGLYYGMWVVPWNPDIFTPSALSQYQIHDNTFATTESGGTGIYLDNETANWIDAAIWNNTVDLQQPGSEGIGDYGANHALIVNNSITSSGTAWDAISLNLGTAHSTVAHNHLTGFGDAQAGSIFLGPQTSENTVACLAPSDSVTDQGTHNRVVGCNG